MYPIFRLAYTSRAKVAFTADALENLAKKSQSNNTRLKVSGLLLYGGGRFLQLLEGDAKTIKDLYENTIVADPRHTDCTELMFSPGDYRLFPEWGMGRLFVQEHDGATQASWDAECNEVARQSPAAVFSRDPAISCMSSFIQHFGDDLDAAMMAAWVKANKVA